MAEGGEIRTHGELTPTLDFKSDLSLSVAVHGSITQIK